MTAKPEVTYRKITPINGEMLRFVIMATDGRESNPSQPSCPIIDGLTVWDCLTSEEATLLVASHISHRTHSDISKTDLPKLFRLLPQPKDRLYPAEDLPGSGSRSSGSWVFEDDDNAATHLIRNSIAGADRVRRGELLSLTGKITRRVRDDVTVTCVLVCASELTPDVALCFLVNSWDELRARSEEAVMGRTLLGSRIYISKCHILLPDNLTRCSLSLFLPLNNKTTMDDLLDLNWSSSPPAQKGVLQANKLHQPTVTRSFDFLAQSSGSSSRPDYYTSTPARSLTPNTPVLNAVSRLKVPAGDNRAGAKTPPSNTPTLASSADAFSSLFSLPNGAGGVPSQTKTMSLAEKQARAAEEKRRLDDCEREKFEAQGAFWETLGVGSKGKQMELKASSHFDDLLQPKLAAQLIRPASAAGTSNVLAKSSPLPRPASSGGFSFVDEDEDDLLDAFRSTGAVDKQRTMPQKATRDLWDLDALSATASNANIRQKAGVGTRTPVLDFSSEERDGDQGHEEDVLSKLGQPSVAARKHLAVSPVLPDR